jgi:hypothetical protein
VRSARRSNAEEEAQLTMKADHESQPPYRKKTVKQSPPIVKKVEEQLEKPKNSQLAKDLFNRAVYEGPGLQTPKTERGHGPA